VGEHWIAKDADDDTALSGRAILDPGADGVSWFLRASNFTVPTMPNLAVLYESHMPAVLLEAGMIVNRAEEQVLSSPARRATVAKAVAGAVERFCAVRVPQT
jgi:hypothetical protein